MWGFEAAGAAAIVENRPIENPDTVASALRIGNPANWQRAVRARDESGGVIATVSDPEILDAYKLLAEGEGVFAEPASAASVAGVLKLAAAGEVKPTDRIVCVLTGHGLKDPPNRAGRGKRRGAAPQRRARSREDPQAALVVQLSCSDEWRQR